MGLRAGGRGGGKDEEGADAYGGEKRADRWIKRGKAFSTAAPAWSGRRKIGGVVAAERTGGEWGIRVRCVCGWTLELNRLASKISTLPR